MANEFLANDHGITLAHGQLLPVLTVCAAGVTVSLSGFPMNPTLKNGLVKYGAQIQSAMLTTATLGLVIATNTFSPSALPAEAVDLTHALIVASMLIETIDIFVDQKPRNIVSTIIDLKLKLPPIPIIRLAETFSLG